MILSIKAVCWYECSIYVLYAESRYAECQYAKYRGAVNEVKNAL